MSGCPFDILPEIFEAKPVAVDETAIEGRFTRTLSSISPSIAMADCQPCQT
jgi:hypothetical protein